MKVIIALILVLNIYGCGADGIPVNNANVPSQENFDITFLFEIEGVKIYRFDDAGHYRYFSIGNGKYLNQTIKNSNGKISYAYDDGVIPQDGGK